MSTILEKRLKKIIELVIVENEEEFSNKFGEAEYKDALKHKTKVATLALEDEQFLEILKDEIEDCIGAYLLSKPLKRKRG